MNKKEQCNFYKDLCKKGQIDLVEIKHENDDEVDFYVLKVKIDNDFYIELLQDENNFDYEKYKLYSYTIFYKNMEFFSINKKSSIDDVINYCKNNAEIIKNNYKKILSYNMAIEVLRDKIYELKKV